jgi:hypothetical protein
VSLARVNTAQSSHKSSDFNMGNNGNNNEQYFGKMDNTRTSAVIWDLRRNRIHGATLAPIPLDSVVDLGDGMHNDGLCHEMKDLALPKCPQIRIQKEEELSMATTMKHR